MSRGEVAKPGQPRGPLQRNAMRFSAAQIRVLSAASNLFVLHGVNGTSLQMIADELGVTKAAVYHQFKTKEEIAVAAAELQLSGLEALLEAAEEMEAVEGRGRAREVLLGQVIEFALARRRTLTTFQGDPVIAAFLGSHEPFRRLLERLHRLMTGEEPSSTARIRSAIISSALAGAVAHPLVLDLDDELLRKELTRLFRRLID